MPVKKGRDVRLKAAKKIEKFFVVLGYASIILDVFIAIITFLVVKRIPYSMSALLAIDYLATIEIVLAAVLFAVLLCVRHYDKVISKLSVKEKNNTKDKYA
jgi:membrane protein implicated in regulation of membrane protease activity